MSDFWWRIRGCDWSIHLGVELNGSVYSTRMLFYVIICVTVVIRSETQWNVTFLAYCVGFVLAIGTAASLFNFLGPMTNLIITDIHGWLYSVYFPLFR